MALSSYVVVIDLFPSCLTAHDTLECLRLTDVDVLQGANAGMAEDAFYGTFIWVPVVDGTFIVRRITESLKQGKVNTVRSASIQVANGVLID